MTAGDGGAGDGGAAATAAAATITSCRRGDNLFAGEAAAAFFAAFSCAHATVESSAASAPRRGVRTSTLLGVRTWRDARGGVAAAVAQPVVPRCAALPARRPPRRSLRAREIEERQRAWCSVGRGASRAQERFSEKMETKILGLRLTSKPRWRNDGRRATARRRKRRHPPSYFRRRRLESATSIRCRSCRRTLGTHTQLAKIQRSHPARRSLASTMAWRRAPPRPCSRLGPGRRASLNGGSGIRLFAGASSAHITATRLAAAAPGPAQDLQAQIDGAVQDSALRRRGAWPSGSAAPPRSEASSASNASA